MKTSSVKMDIDFNTLREFVCAAVTQNEARALEILATESPKAYADRDYTAARTATRNPLLDDRLRSPLSEDPTTK